MGWKEENFRRRSARLGLERRTSPPVDGVKNPTKPTNGQYASTFFKVVFFNQVAVPGENNGGH
jgi:hypothetical protein